MRPLPGPRPTLLPLELGGVAPALLALLFAVWCGSLWHGAAAVPAGVGHALVLAAPLVLLAGAGRSVGARFADPWRLGFPGLLLPWALLAAAMLATWASPVSRAGWIGVALLPAWLCLPAAVARCWRSPAARRWGVRGLSVGVAVVAGTALRFWLAGVSPRPSLPVGQHLHLTVWIVVLLPLAALPWREGGLWRAIAALSVLLGVAAVLGTRTLSGLLALGVETVLALRWTGATRPPRIRVAAAAAAVLALAAIGGAEMWKVVRGTDPSGSARFVYWRAGWEGVTERPATGYGPGSTAWTLPLLLEPEPGVNPPGEVVGELHLLPLAVAYELGLPGALLACGAVGLFVWRRRRERSGGPADLGFVAAGLAGLAGGAAATLATGEWRVTALPMAAAVAAGAALAGARREREEADAGPAARRSGGHRAAPALYALYALAVALFLAPLLRAHAAYDRALATSVEDPRAAFAELERAAALDPRFPLYRARRAWLAAERLAEGAEVAGWDARRSAVEAMAAGEAARGVPALWLAAGAAAEALGEEWIAAPAYERACSADPLGALAPFGLVRVASPLHDRTEVAARALAAEPRLAAALWWRGREGLLAAAVERLAATGGIEPGWREAVRDRLASVERSPEGPLTDLGQTADVRDESSLSLHAFRRRPWGTAIMPVRLDGAAAAELADLPPATALPATDPRLFPPTCLGEFVPRDVGATPYRLR